MALTNVDPNRQNVSLSPQALNHKKQCSLSFLLAPVVPQPTVLPPIRKLPYDAAPSAPPSLPRIISPLAAPAARMNMTHSPQRLIPRLVPRSASSTMPRLTTPREARPPVLVTPNTPQPPPQVAALVHGLGYWTPSHSMPDAPTAPKRKFDVLAKNGQDTDTIYGNENSGAADLGSDDARLEDATHTCQTVRQTIRTLLDSGAMKVDGIQRAFGVSAHAYGRFMDQSRAKQGEKRDTYWKACAFFKKREHRNVEAPANVSPRPNKRARLDVLDQLDVAGVGKLDGEDDCSVSVYDTCDEVRKKIRAFLKRDGMTQAAFLREIVKTFPDGRKFQSNQLTRFLAQTGPRGGCSNPVFYSSYVFFEKLRLKELEPKSAHFVQIERIWDGKNN